MNLTLQYQINENVIWYWYLDSLSQNRLRRKYMPDLKWLVKRSRNVLKGTWKKACRNRSKSCKVA